MRPPKVACSKMLQRQRLADCFGCEDGVCGTCLIKAHGGKENLSQMEEKEAQTLDMMCMKDGEHRLCCQCKVNGDVTIEGM